MANYVFNIAKGRVVEYYNRVENNDPAASHFEFIPMTTIGTEAQGQDFDDLALVIADGNFSEATGGGWVRKDIGDAELAALPLPDDAADKFDVQVPEVTWTGPAAANNTLGLIIAYDAAAAGADNALIPLTVHDFVVTTDGNDVVLQVGDFFQAS